MYIYVIIIVLIIILGYILKPSQNQKNKKKYLILIFTILTIVSAIRNYTVGVDTEQFCRAFEYIGGMSISNAIENTRYELGFVLLCKLLSFISDNSQILIIATSIIIMTTIAKFIYEESDDVVLSTLLFVLLNYYAMYMNVMRQAMAIAIIIISYKAFLKNGKNIKFTLAVLVASLFHQSALVMLILIFFRNKKFSKKYYFISLLIGFLVFVFADKLFSILLSIFSSYQDYQTSVFAESNYFAAIFNAIVLFIFYTVGIIYIDFKNTKKSDSINFYAYMVMINFLLYIATIKISIFTRATTYFNIFNIIWIPAFIKNIQNKLAMQIILLMLLFFTILYWGIISVYRPEWYGVIPYETFMSSNV